MRSTLALDSAAPSDTRLIGTSGGRTMSQQNQVPKDATLQDTISSGKDEIRLGNLKTYIFESDISLKKIPVRVSFRLAHGSGAGKTTETPSTLGDLRRLFKGNLSFENPHGEHDRSFVVATYQDPETGQERTERIALAMIYVES